MRTMVVIGFALLALGMVVALLLAVADPVMLSRINGEPAEGQSGRHINAPRVGAEVVPMPERRAGTTPKAA